MRPQKWLEDKGVAYVGLLAGSTVGVALLIAYTATAIVGISFEPIEPSVIAALTIILAVMAEERSNSNSANGG